ncbi:uncharacterized protein [Halyomorpha halys]|uniref:uncharacterized protein n=1 Tax=Halyomorpha halys TaxID=286706 RepID=UPI0034D175C0
MEDYLNEILSLSQKLETIGAGLEDEFIGVIMLSGLSEEYEPMIMAMKSTGFKTTSDYIRSVLIQKSSKEESGEESALVKKSKKSDRPTVSCCNCKKPGHISVNCAEGLICFNCKKKGLKSTECRKKGSVKKNVNNNNKSTLLASLSSVISDSNDWIIYSGATSHMTKNKHWLSDCSENKQEISVANNEKIISEAVGSVNLSRLINH